MNTVNNTNTIVANLGAGLAGRLLSQLISFFIVVYLARILGPADYGDISLAFAIVSYFELLAVFGLPTIGIREVAATQRKSMPIVSTIFSLRLFLSLISYLLLMIYGYLFVANTRIFHLLLLYGLTMISTAFILDWFFVGTENLQAVSIATVAGNVVNGGLTFFLINSTADIYFIPMNILSMELFRNAVPLIFQ